MYFIPDLNAQTLQDVYFTMPIIRGILQEILIDVFTGEPEKSEEIQKHLKKKKKKKKQIIIFFLNKIIYRKLPSSYFSLCCR